MEHECDGDVNYNWCAWNNPLRLGKGTKRHRNERRSGDHPDFRIILIGQNTRPEDLRRHVVTQNPGKNHL